VSDVTQSAATAKLQIVFLFMFFDYEFYLPVSGCGGCGLHFTDSQHLIPVFQVQN
jgi:hypothetical protein